MRVVAFAAVACAACTIAAPPPFHCTRWSECGDGGACEITTACSFADATCPAGRRYGDLSEPALAGTCVDYFGGFDGLCDADHPCNAEGRCDHGRCLSVAQLSARGNLACARCEDQGLWCWGQFRQAGAGTLPLVPASFRAGVDAVVPQVMAEHAATGADFFCVSDGVQDRCFGANDHGQLESPPGSGLILDAAPKPFTAIAAGDHHACGIGTDGFASCWGSNSSHQIDATSVLDVDQPVEDLRLGGVTRVAAGASYSCAASPSQVACWGDELGWAPGTFDAGGLVAGLTGSITALVAGSGHACATVDGRVWCWGRDDQGQSSNRPGELALPSLPFGDRAVVEVAPGRSHTCATTPDGEIWCWGNNANHQLGADTTAAAPVRALADQIDARGPIAAGDDFTCALLEDNLVHCWGADANIDLDTGNGTTFSTAQIAVCVRSLEPPSN